jgi:translation elongation factor EF-Ts
MALTGLSCKDCGAILSSNNGNIAMAIRSLKEGAAQEISERKEGQ